MCNLHCALCNMSSALLCCVPRFNHCSVPHRRLGLQCCTTACSAVLLTVGSACRLQWVRLASNCSVLLTVGQACFTVCSMQVQLALQCSRRLGLPSVQYSLAVHLTVGQACQPLTFPSSRHLKPAMQQIGWSKASIYRYISVHIGICISI